MTNEEYILKAKSANLTDEKIAAKLGVSVDEVRQVWQAALDETQRVIASGYLGLCEQFSTLCQRQKLVNESMQTIGKAIGNQATISEVASLLADMDPFIPNDAAKKILSEFIVLKRFAPPTPQESLQMLDGQN